jgi:hypothetical protein
MILKWCSVVHQVVMHRKLSLTVKYEAVPYPKSGIFTSEASYINRSADIGSLKADETLGKSAP